ncbi:cyclin-G2 isoform X1 [Oryzias melastigma]|uniref:Cyclin G2 n=1 Tax=Oryzias melastigma TaxID=30732 RepID=A0A3B3BWS1_ORYME|nr:cyclin-G2 isoform X1 [Oryzias melastigma]
MRDPPGIDNLLLKKLKVCCAKEDSFLPREMGLKLMESTPTENSSGVSAKCRDSRVEELWGLTTFFGYSIHTFVQAVNLLDRFLTLMKVQRKHVPCIGVCCLHMAAKMMEEEADVSPTHELIRISQSKFTVSDLSRMEKIISEKLCLDPKAVTALTFLQLYHAAISTQSAGREEIPSFGRLEAQLKACLCRLVFSKAKPSVLALSLIAQDDGLQSLSVMKIVQQFQRHLKISDAELLGWKELVAECMSAYHSSQCSKPDNRKLVWIVSRRTAQGLQSGHFSVPALPTIPEISWDQNESEDSSEDSSCSEESPCGSLGSDGEETFFPSRFHHS